MEERYQFAYERQFHVDPMKEAMPGHFPSMRLLYLFRIQTWHENLIFQMRHTHQLIRSLSLPQCSAHTNCTLCLAFLLYQVSPLSVAYHSKWWAHFWALGIRPNTASVGMIFSHSMLEFVQSTCLTITKDYLSILLLQITTSSHLDWWLRVDFRLIDEI